MSEINPDSGEIKVIALVKFNDGVALVLNRSPNILYERNCVFLFAKDGLFHNFYYYRRPDYYSQAFAGRVFDIPMLDGSFERANGQWWDGCPRGYKGIAIGTIEKLKKCYVFWSSYALANDVENLISSHDGPVYPYWEYEKIIKYDDLRKDLYEKISKLEKDKKVLISEKRSIVKELAHWKSLVKTPISQ